MIKHKILSWNFIAYIFHQHQKIVFTLEKNCSGRENLIALILVNNICLSQNKSKIIITIIAIIIIIIIIIKQ